MYKLSNRSKKRLKGINDILLAIVEEGIKESPFDFGIPAYGGFRTEQDQRILYCQGRTRSGKIITWLDGTKKKSYHQTGNAVDIYAYVNGMATWELKYLEPIARHLQKIAKEKYNIKLDWGQDLWGKDGAHLQITK